MPPSVLITGCSEPTALGAAVCKSFLSRGFLVFATARNPSTLSALQSSGCQTLPLDVTSQSSIDSAVEQVSKLTGGRLNVLVNNAGVYGYSHVLDVDVEAAQRMFDVNVFGMIRMVKSFAPLLVKAANSEGSPEGEKFATIINFGSIGGEGPLTPGSIYAGSKAAMHTISDALRLEMKNLNVQVTTVLNGMVDIPGGTKTIPLRTAESSSPYYPNFESILSSHRERAAQQTKSAKKVEVHIEKVLNQILGKKQIEGRIYEGSNAGSFKWIMPFLPRTMVEDFFYKAGALEMVETPNVD